jgi:hypothetical protein
VACSCGDVVVSDTRLLATDPVVSAPCLGNGLLLQAPRGSRSIRLDLAGQTIRGSGQGVGVRVLDGGQDGAVVVGGSGGQRGALRGFRNGVRAHGRSSLGSLTRVDADDNAREGVRLWGVETRIRDVTARGNGRTGVRVGGHSPVLERIEARDNGRDGVHVTGAEPRLGDITVTGNGKAQARLPRARVRP